MEELCESMRLRLLSVSYTPAEVEVYHVLIRRLNTSTKWLLNYFDYYETYKESNPVILLMEVDNLHKQMGEMQTAGESESFESLMDDPGDPVT
jgi:hypothetical protein